MKAKTATFKMDAAIFYGTADVRDHGRQRRRLTDDSAERLLSRIGDGNTSDIGLSDDEEEGNPNQSAVVRGNEAGPSGAAQPDAVYRPPNTPPTAATFPLASPHVLDLAFAMTSTAEAGSGRSQSLR
ncbi:hypothetical protein V5799_034092 [Amblyomma americanum]|uniref:Uncharacterized protein n=1 Tax=Amblyomma americanum TaxID=6943 RepID=A0AAQ4DLG0_AMBAM